MASSPLWPPFGFGILSAMAAPLNSSLAERSRLAGAILTILAPVWPDGGPQLHYRDCFELLVAVVLSAQCTDDQVNRVTPVLFAGYPDARAMAAAPLARIEELVRSTGFYHNKARHLIGLSAAILERFGGEVPRTIDELVTLPGVGRKTANLVASACFGAPGIVVDTHVLRTARRLGIAPTDDPARSERFIAEAVPRESWTQFSYALNRHGKFTCTARKPACHACALAALCPSAGLA